MLQISQVIVLLIAIQQVFGQNIGNMTLMARLLENLASLGNTDLNFVSDFVLSTQSELVIMTQELGVPLAAYNIGDIAKEQKDMPPEKCPIFGTGLADGYENGAVLTDDSPFEYYSKYETKLLKRRPFLHSQRFHKSIFIWLSEKTIEQTHDIFNKTAMYCSQKIEVGVFNEATRFYILVANKTMADKIFKFGRFRMHGQVAAIYPTVNDGELAVANFNFFLASSNESKIANVWREDRPLQGVDDVFMHLNDFQGYFFNVGAVPWSHHVAGEEVSDEEGGNDTYRYRDYWGYEIDLLNLVSEKLNFNYVLMNQEDGLWGAIQGNSSWSGKVGGTATGRFDFIISDIFITFGRTQVYNDKKFIQLIHKADPESRPVVITIFKILSCYFSNSSKTKQSQVKIVTATGGTVGLTEWIMNNTSLVTFGTAQFFNLGIRWHCNF